ncbi:MAG: FAD-binding oxidoreductase [bacterium]
MAIDNEAYQALEDVVGPEYITREPVVLDTYCYVWANELLVGDKFSARPLAVVLPATVEEVQAIVKVCNRFKIRYRAFASGFETSAVTASEPMLPIDMRRMDRIVEIDRRNRTAVVEPYVSQTRLFLETMKVGLRPNMIGAGPSASVLAGTAAHFGSGPTNISTDFGGRNLLGVEWVLPDGDLVRLGPVGAGATGVNADGPGPSLRGVVRGYGGANGGIGIFTKAAVKLYPWYGPPKLEPRGGPPIYGMKVPENFEDLIVFFPGREELSDFMHLLYEEGIAFSQERPGLMFPLLFSTGSNDEFYELIKDVPAEMAKTLSYSMVVGLDAISAREMEYKKRVFHEILKVTNGSIYPVDDHVKGLLFNASVTAQGMVRGAFRMAGSFVISPVSDESFDSVNRMATLAYEEILAEAQASGQVFGPFPEPAWSVIYGSDGCGHVEMITQYDPADPESCRETADIIQKADARVAEWGFGINLLENALSFKEASLRAALPHALDFATWMKKIKKAFDPGDVAESSFYVSPDA